MKTEKALGILFLIALILRLAHIPGGTAFSIISLGILSMVYFPFGFYFLSGKTFQQQNIGLSLGIGMALSLVVIGILFRVMHWPGALFIQLASFGGSIPLVFVVQSLRKKEHPEELDDYYRLLYWRLIAINTVALFFFLLSFTAFRI